MPFIGSDEVCGLCLIKECAFGNHNCLPAPCHHTHARLCCYATARKERWKMYKKACCQTQTWRVHLFCKGYTQVTGAEVTRASLNSNVAWGKFDRKKTKLNTKQLSLFNFGWQRVLFVEFGTLVTSSYNLYKHHSGSQKAVSFTLSVLLKSPMRGGAQPQNTLPKDILHVFVAKETKRGGFHSSTSGGFFFFCSM